MDHGLAFTYFVKKATGVSNVLLATLCQFIPVVGPIVLGGYKAEVVDALNNDPERRDHPDFSFDRFSQYLSRGIWPFLVQLAYVMLVGMPFMVLIYVAGFVSAAVNSPIPVILVAVVGVPLAVVVGVGLVLPWTFHAEVTRGFDLAGGWRFVRQFWGLLGGTAVAAILMLTVMSAGVTMLGMLACCVGVYPAATIAQMATQHVMVQLYQMYLDRGGEPLAPPPAYPGDYPPPGGYYPPPQGYPPPGGRRSPQNPPQEW